MPFQQDHVDVRSVGDTDWRLLAGVKYKGNEDMFTVPVDSDTDFASVPRVFVWLLPTYGRYTKAAILHDYLWRHAVPEGKLSLSDADGIFVRAMRELGVPFLQRWMMWAAVRLGALVKRDGRAGWLQASWRVFPIALLAVPIAIPPAIVIFLALAIFYAIEALFYIPLAISRRSKARRGVRAKEVNAPSLELKLN